MVLFEGASNIGLAGSLYSSTPHLTFPFAGLTVSSWLILLSLDLISVFQLGKMGGQNSKFGLIWTKVICLELASTRVRTSEFNTYLTKIFLWIFNEISHFIYRFHTWLCLLLAWLKARGWYCFPLTWFQVSTRKNEWWKSEIWTDLDEGDLPRTHLRSPPEVKIQDLLHKNFALNFHRNFSLHLSIC